MSGERTRVRLALLRRGASALLVAVAIVCASWGFVGAAWAAAAATDDEATSSEEAAATDDEEAAENAAESDGNTVSEQQLPDSSFLYDTSISDLDEADSYMDGQTVQITGEVVGDRIVAEGDSNYCWLTIEAVDGSYAEISAYVPVSLAEVIDTYGAYNKTGTVVQLQGTFNLACAEHEGLSDLHVDGLTVVSSGTVEHDQLDVADFAPGALLVVVGLALAGVFRYMRERQR